MFLSVAHGPIPHIVRVLIFGGENYKMMMMMMTMMMTTVSYQFLAIRESKKDFRLCVHFLLSLFFNAYH